ncbi:MAG: ABC transporter permease [Lachnospiraceae bacterium]|nr:ABC transporter permease [Lachnospiraceae bacterium]
MLNLIRMNSYRTVHMACMYVLLVIVCIFSVFSIATISMTEEEIESGEYVDYESVSDAMEAGWNDAAMENGDVDSLIGEVENEDEEVMINLGIVSEQPIRADGTVTSYLDYLYQDMTSGILLIFMTIAVVLFFNREQNSGFIKNIASKSTSRINIYFSKFIVMIAYMLVAFLVMALAEYICLMIHYGGDLTFGKDVLGDFIPKIGVVFLLHIAFISGVAMITTLTKSSTMGITIGMLANTGFSAFLTMPIKALLDFDIAKYLVTSNIGNVNLDSGTDVVTHALLVGIITIIVYNVIGCTWFAKKDIA